jgi:hypothetical protein
MTGETATEIGGDCGDETLCPRSPFDATITAGAVSTNSSSTGEGLRDAQAGVDASFSVSCLDWWGNERVDMTSAGFFKGRLACAGPCEGPSSTPCSGPCSAALADRVDTSSTFNADEQLEFDLLPVGGGTYEGLYNIELAGSYLLTLVSPTAVNLVDANIRTLKNSPTTVVVVPSRSSAERSLCTGAGLSTSVAGVTAAIDIQGIDEFGNYARDQLIGTDGFSAVLSTGTPIVVTNVGEGTHRAAFTETLAGTFSINVFLTFGGQDNLVDESKRQICQVVTGLMTPMTASILYFIVHAQQSQAGRQRFSYP